MDSQANHSDAHRYSVSTLQKDAKHITGMQVKERRTDWQRVIYGASSCSRRVRLLFSSSPSLSSLPDVSHPPWERETEGIRSHLGASKWENTKESRYDLSQIWSLTSSFVLFLLGDFCLDSPRDFPLDLSFSLSFSFSLPFRSFSPSDSGEACKTKTKITWDIHHIAHYPVTAI